MGHDPKRNPLYKASYLRVASILFFFTVWFSAATIVQNEVLPGPIEVFSFMIGEIKSGDLLYHLSLTLMRVAAAFLLAMLLGSAIGIYVGQNRIADNLADPWIILFLNMPALVIIILAYVWIGLTEVAAIVAVSINKIPNVIITLREGTRALETEYHDMAKVYNFSRHAMMRHVVLPQLYPYIAVSARSGLSLIWKIVLVVELLGRSNGVGFQIHLYFQLFDVKAILGYTLAFVIVILLIEFLLVQPIEERANRWRPKPV